MNPWPAILRIITSSPFVFAFTILAIVLLTHLVMAHNYKLGVQWSHDAHLELAPATAPVSSAER